MSLRFDTGQSFTCAGCARCCHGEVVITPGEREVYERAGAARWFREAEDGAEGASAEVFVPLPGRPGWSRLRRRGGGACGFLSPQNRCRLHEELGGHKKPLVCRMFPFAVHRTEREVIVTASFSCPTVIANEGEPLPKRVGTLGGLRADWERAFGRDARPVLLARGWPMASRAVDTMRERLGQMLEAGAPDGAGLAGAVAHMTAWIQDLARPRVVRLPPEDLAEYLAVTGRYAVETQRAAVVGRPSALARVRARGIVFVAVAAEMQRRHPGSGLRLGLRWRLARLLFHAHGLLPAMPELDIRARRRVRLDRDAIAPILRHYLRSCLTTLGTGARPVLDEVGRAAAVANTALVLAAMHAERAGDTFVGAKALREGLVRASDLDHLEGTLASMVDSFASGEDAWVLLAHALRAE